MQRVLVLRHVAFEDLGRLEPLLEADGFDIRYFDVGVDSFSDHFPLEADLVIVLGGAISAYELDTYPFLKTEIAWLRARLIEDLPTLGICLGAQLIAAALDAPVYAGTAGKEIGWKPLTAGADTGALPWFDDFIHSGAPVLHWHGDTFDLPRGARHLASSELYRNQAFSWGKHCLALQFHAEFDANKLERWLIGHHHELHQTTVTNLAQLRADTARFAGAAQGAADKFWNGWLSSLNQVQARLQTRLEAPLQPGSALPALALH
jgi:GMP synthase (glutamine-hydrolysing)